MTCKECLHLEACCDFVPFDGTTEELSHYLDECTEQPCEHFKNKADFVEVVRCPDCIYCENMKCTELKDNSGHALDVAIFDYCSQGIRK